MKYRVEFCDDLMHVLDGDGNGHDAHVIGNGPAAVYAAKMKLHEWKRIYPGVDYTKAARMISRIGSQEGAQS